MINSWSMLNVSPVIAMVVTHAHRAGGPKLRAEAGGRRGSKEEVRQARRRPLFISLFYPPALPVQCVSCRLHRAHMHALEEE